MPQTSHEIASLITKWFGSIDTFGPTKLLESHGFKLHSDWVWEKPTPAHTVSEIEGICLQFLVEEWDYDWIRGTYSYLTANTEALASASAPPALAT